MARRLPPLNAVRSFEAAARHLSFHKAAEELHVTPGAVSQQVKSLEEWLGLPLFRRMPSGVRLTDAGQAYWPKLRDLLDRLADLTATIRRSEEPKVVTVSTVPSLASLWLIPRLGDLRLQQPDLDVRVVAAIALADFDRDGVDLAIRFGLGRYPGMSTELLMEEEFFPVCSPAIAASLREPSDLKRHILLHDDVESALPEQITWQDWAAAAGMPDLDTDRGPHFSHTHMTLNAAAMGQGVALATNVLMADSLAMERLVRPFGPALRGHYSYWLVCPPEVLKRPAVAAFRAWLIGQARSTEITPGR